MSWVARNRRSVIDLEVDIISRQLAIDTIVNRAKSGEPGYVCFANVHMTIESYDDKKFAEQVNNASLVLSDGMPLVKYVNYFYGCKQERVAGMDVFNDTLRLAEANHLKMFFFGTTPHVLEIIKNKVMERFPRSNVVGILSPPFDKSLDDEAYISAIVNSEANLVFVALGCPKQEKWMANHSHKINAVLLGVGGAFPVFANITKRAPLSVQNIGLEWLYRLLQEPRRLFRRYFRTNTKFLFLVLKERVKVVLGRTVITLF